MATYVKNTLKNGSTSWTAVVRKRGAQPAKKTFRYRRDAEGWANDTEAKIQRGAAGIETVEASKHTLAEVIERFIADPEYAMDRSGQKRLRWWKERIGNLTLVQLTPVVINDEREALRQGKGLSKKPASGPTINRYTSALSKALKVAVAEYGWMDLNPCRAISRKKESKARDRILEDSEREALLEACRKSADPRLYPLVAMALYTGARKGELMGLTWEDVSWLEGSATAQLEDTKNGDRRTLTIAGPAYEALLEWKSASKVRKLQGETYIFAPSDPTTDISNWFPRRPWMKAMKDAEIEGFTFHGLRHCCASYLAMSGASLPEIAAYIGHRNLQMVQRYSHLTEQHQSEVGLRMVEKFGRK